MERSLAIREQVLGAQHPGHGAAASITWACCCRTMGDLAGARPYLERSLAIREQVLGAMHPDTAHSLWWMGVLLIKEGKPGRGKTVPGARLESLYTYVGRRSSGHTGGAAVA